MIRLLKLKPEVYEYYVYQVKGNEFTSFDQAQRKLTRNVLLGHKLESSWFRTTYIYGCLEIVVRFNTIIEIKNHTEKLVKDWWLDRQEYERLNRILGIRDSKFKRK